FKEAEEHGVGSICLFTRIPEFFSQFGFRVARREELPDKMYKDCVKCPRLHACDEVAMVRGELPKISILPKPRKIDVLLPRLLARGAKRPTPPPASAGRQPSPASKPAASRTWPLRSPTHLHRPQRCSRPTASPPLRLF